MHLVTINLIYNRKQLYINHNIYIIHNSDFDYTATYTVNTGKVEYDYVISTLLMYRGMIATW